MKLKQLGAGLAAAALCFSAGRSHAAKPTPSPAFQVPSEAEIMERMSRNMGKAPIKEAAESADGVQVVLQTGHSAQLSAVAVSADGRYMLSGALDETAKLWDVASGQEIRTITGSGGLFGMLGPRTVLFSRDSSRMLVADMAGFKVYDIASGRELRSANSTTLFAVTSGDGQLAVVQAPGAGARGLRIVDLVTGDTLWNLPVEQSESAVAMSADGTTLLTQLEDVKSPRNKALGAVVNGELRLWDVTARKLRGPLPPSLGNLQQGMVLSPDGKLLLTPETLAAHTLGVFDIQTGQKLLSLAIDLQAMQGMTTTLTFSPDGRMVAWATSADVARVWEIPSGKLLVDIKASALAFSADSRQLVVGRSSGGAPLLRDIASGAETLLAAGASAIVDVAVTADGRSVVAATSNGGAKLWDLTTGQLLRTYECPGGGASSVSVSGKVAPLLAIGCMDGSASIWELNTGREVRKLVAANASQPFAYAFVRFSRDGRRLALAVNRDVSLWDVASGQVMHRIALGEVAKPRFMGPAMVQQEPAQDAALDDPRVAAAMQAVRAIALHPDGELVAIGRAGQVALWNLSTGEQVRIVSGSGAAASIPVAAPQATLPQGKLPRGLGNIAGMPAGAMGALLQNMLGQAGGMSGSGPGGVITMADPTEALDMMTRQMEGSHSLAFNQDGRLLLMLGSRGPRVWDVASGQEVRPPKAAAAGLDAQRLMDSMLNMQMVEGEGIALSPDERIAARGIGRVIKVWDLTTGAELAALSGHTSDVSSLTFTADGRSIVSGGHDGAIRIWNVATHKESVALIALGHADFVAVTPDQYYRASKSRIKGVAFRVKDQLYPFEQFDLRFNRPDIVLERLGTAAPELVQSYRYAYQHRLKKLGFTENMLGTDFHLPELEFLTRDVPVSTTDPSLSLRVRARDAQFTLDRLNVFVNDVPVYGSAGLPLPDKQLHALEQEIKVPLASGRNKIQVSVLNQQGTESLKQTVYTNAVGIVAPAATYVVVIGVSQYKNSRYNLRYAAKDANDLASAYEALGQRAGERGQVHVLRLTDDQATRTQIQQAKAWLASAKVNDLVVVFAAGHGMTDSASNYYFGTYDIDPERPAANGLPYAEFEALLDGIPALQKVLLLDTCFSGEIDKDDQIVVAQAETVADGTVKMRAFKAARGVNVVADTSGALSGDMLRFQQDWFADLRRGTGAAVISSSSGNEYSLEGEQWNNGVFTYSLLLGLKNGEADANKDHVIAVSELQAYVIDKVRKLTQGGQNPTARRENLDYDFAVYR